MEVTTRADRRLRRHRLRRRRQAVVLDRQRRARASGPLARRIRRGDARATSTASTRPRSRPAAATTGRPAFARTITRTTTARSCSIPTATTSKRSATPGLSDPDQDRRSGELHRARARTAHMRASARRARIDRLAHLPEARRADRRCAGIFRNGVASSPSHCEIAPCARRGSIDQLFVTDRADHRGVPFLRVCNQLRAALHHRCDVGEIVGEILLGAGEVLHPDRNAVSRSLRSQ